MELSLHAPHGNTEKGLIMGLIQRFFSKYTQKRCWHSIIRDGDLIRTCSITGEMQYRDVAQQKWIPINSQTEIDAYRSKRGIY